MNPAQTLATHTCPIDGCQVRLPHHILLCAPHWRRVPRDLQIRVNSLWRGRSVADYLTARQEAIEIVNKKVQA